jgi:hypothetical protein
MALPITKFNFIEAIASIYLPMDLPTSLADPKGKKFYVQAT